MGQSRVAETTSMGLKFGLGGPIGTLALRLEVGCFCEGELLSSSGTVLGGGVMLGWCCLAHKQVYSP